MLVGCGQHKCFGLWSYVFKRDEQIRSRDNPHLDNKGIAKANKLYKGEHSQNYTKDYLSEQRFIVIKDFVNSKNRNY